MAYFTGTSTGNHYTVGHSYIGSQGDVMVANADGSFTNQRTGRSSVGSSQSDTAYFSDRKSGVDGQSRSGVVLTGKQVADLRAKSNVIAAAWGLPSLPVAGPAAGVVVSSPAAVVTGGPGKPAASSGKLGATTGSGPGKTGAVVVPDGGVRIGDYFLFPDERFPNVEDFWEPRYGEPGEWVGGGLNMTADSNANVERLIQQSITVREGSPAAWMWDWINGVASSPGWVEGGGTFGLPDALLEQSWVTPDTPFLEGPR